MNGNDGKALRRALIIGGSTTGLQAALDLADSGIEVHLVESLPFLSFSGLDAAARRSRNARCLEAYLHPNVTIWSNTKVNLKGGEIGHFHITLQQAPRYVDLARCTACGDCITACPVSVIDTDLQGTFARKAIYLDGQPGCATIDKHGLAPCRAHCPINQRAQGYIALIRQGRFADAYRTIKNENPFPSVCGRVCNHRCEDNCSRGKYDEPVNIMGLKRFVADWAFAHRNEIEPGAGSPASHHQPKNGKRVAIIGAGPAGLTAALELVRLGYAVTVFDKLPMAGGMMRVGIPPHRLPGALLDWEIQQILDEGVQLHLNTWIDDIPALLDQGYHAVLIATGAHHARKLPIRHSNHPNNWLSLDILRKARLSETPSATTPSTSVLDLTGKKVIVLGGGNVALDTARTVLRLGADQVQMACLEPRGEMPGFAWEVSVAESEGIQMYPGRTFKEIVVQQDEIVGVRCAEIEFHGFKHGRPEMTEIPGSEHILPADIVVWAIGQAPNFSFLPEDGSINTRYPVGVQADENMMTTMEGVFVAGDVRRGVTFFVVDAIAEGHFAARSINHYLCADQDQKAPTLPPVVTLMPDEIEKKIKTGEVSAKQRVPIQSISLEARLHNFQEVDLTLTEAEVLAEAERCLGCGVCSECLACVEACEAGAVIHEQSETITELDFGVIMVVDDPAHPLLSLPASRGYYHAPPEDVLLGSVVTAHVMADLGGKKNLEKHIRVTQPHIQDTPRIGVFVCQCGGEIARVVDTAAVRARAATCPDVAYTQVLPFSCSAEAAQTINEAIGIHSLNRVVLAACSCCAQDQVCDSCTFQRVRCKDNLGVPLSPANSTNPGTKVASFEFVNIREQCAWPHAHDPQAATHKAITLTAAAIARARAPAYPPQELTSIDPSASYGTDYDYYSVLILGSGAAGQSCHEALSNAGVIVRHNQITPGQIRRTGGKYVAFEKDASHNKDSIWRASALVLAPVDAAEAHRLQIACGPEPHQPRPSKMAGSVNTHRPGIYYCDFSGDARTLGTAAAVQAIAWLGRTVDQSLSYSAQVNPIYCRACSTCVEICEFGAPELVGEPPRITAWIDPAICIGCGICTVHCPSGAITTAFSPDLQLEALLDSARELP